MVITITHDDLDKGNKSVDACPITVALRRTFKNEKITISRDFIRVPKKRSKKWKLIPLPRAAQDMLLYYHSYYSPQPFSFTLNSKSVAALKG